MQIMKLLLIGPLPPPIGGTSVSFKQLLTDLQEEETITVKVLNTSPQPQLGIIGKLINIPLFFLKLLRALPSFDIVSLHASNRRMIIYGSALRIICLIFRKPLVVRIFGGSFDRFYKDASWCAHYFISLVFTSDCILLQTHKLVDFFSPIYPHSKLRWFPTSRSEIIKIEPEQTRRDIRRFVFVGHVKPTKGIREILKACETLKANNYLVDIYGPLQKGVTEEEINRARNVRYQGVLEPEEVLATISTYDVLVFPTYYQGEGYPGVIIEAYMAGIPVISTYWQAIPEIVKNGESGLLVPPKDAELLARAMQEFIDSQEIMAHCKKGAEMQAQQFSSKRWNRDEFLRICCEEVANGCDF